MKVNLKEIAQELQTLSDEDCFCYNKISGELEYFNSEQENPNDLDIDEIDEDENFVALPSKYSIDDYGIMKDFMFAQEDKKSMMQFTMLFIRKELLENFVRQLNRPAFYRNGMNLEIKNMKKL